MRGGRKLSKTEKRDIRDNASLMLSGISTAVGVAALVFSLNERLSDAEEDIYYSEMMGPIRR